MYQKLITGDINLFSIKDYFIKNPSKIKEILNYNKRYIFFELSEKISAQSKGAFGLELNSSQVLQLIKIIIHWEFHCYF